MNTNTFTTNKCLKGIKMFWVQQMKGIYMNQHSISQVLLAVWTRMLMAVLTKLCFLLLLFLSKDVLNFPTLRCKHHRKCIPDLMPKMEIVLFLK